MLLARKTMSLKDDHETKKASSRSKDIKPKRVLKLFNPAGKPYNVNQPKIPFELNDEFDRDNIILEVFVYR